MNFYTCDIADELDTLSGESAYLDAQGLWPAHLTLAFHANAKRTFVHRSHRGPLMIQRPFYPEGQVCHVTVLHPPGGVVSGDKLMTQVRVNSGAQAVVVTPGATKHYRSRRTNNLPLAQTQAQGEVRQELFVNQGSLEWLPNETIHFNGSETKVDTRIHLRNDAHVIAIDVQVFGRRAGDLPFVSGRADVGLSVYREGEPQLIDKLRVHGDSFSTSAAGLRGYTVYGTLLATDASDDMVESVTRFLHEIHPVDEVNGYPLVSATRVDELLLVRFLGHHSEQALLCLRAVREHIRPSVIGLKNYTPRVWST